MTLQPKVRFATWLGGSTTGTVVWALNHLLQRRQFAYDGRQWYYQPTTRDPFRPVNATDLPDNAVAVMSAATGIPEYKLREERGVS